MNDFDLNPAATSPMHPADTRPTGIVVWAPGHSWPGCPTMPSPSTLAAMNAEQVLKKYFGKLRGLPCWGTSMGGWGSWIRLHFGKPRLEIRGPFPEAKSKRLQRRHVHIDSDTSIWIDMCDWELFDDGKRVCHSESPKWFAHRKEHVLNGQCLVHVGIQIKPLAFGLHFEYGTLLVLHRYPRARPDWELFHLYQGKNLLDLRSNGVLRHGPTKLDKKLPKLAVTDIDLDI
ncbi:MAG: hypothetical protein IT462_09435 [Planctomycetes bacterium]|nr:hypothetical protein [Planctomycetota bacterium]